MNNHDFETNKERLVNSISEHLDKYPRRKLKIDVNSEGVLALWDEFNNAGFYYKMEAGPFASLKEDIVSSYNQLVKLKESLTNLELNQINFHFGNHKSDNIKVDGRILLNAIKLVLIERLPERNIIRKDKNDSVWAQLGTIQRPLDYESSALTS